MNKVPGVVMKHVAGKRFVAALKAHEEEKKKAAEKAKLFSPVGRGTKAKPAAEDGEEGPTPERKKEQGESAKDKDGLKRQAEGGPEGGKKKRKKEQGESAKDKDGLKRQA